MAVLIKSKQFKNQKMIKKKPEDSKTIMTELVMPNDTNAFGNLMGGNLMKWMDIAGAICAGRHAANPVVTASVDNVSFQNSIKLGDVITLVANVTRTFNTSLEVYIEVSVHDILNDINIKTNHAYLTFVSLDRKTLKPTPVPELEPSTDREKELYEGASRRREIRLILAGRMKPSEAILVKEYLIKHSEI